MKETQGDVSKRKLSHVHGEQDSMLLKFQFFRFNALHQNLNKIILLCAWEEKSRDHMILKEKTEERLLNGILDGCPGGGCCCSRFFLISEKYLSKLELLKGRVVKSGGCNSLTAAGGLVGQFLPVLPLGCFVFCWLGATVVQKRCPETPGESLLGEPAELPTSCLTLQQVSGHFKA